MFCFLSYPNLRVSVPASEAGHACSLHRSSFLSSLPSQPPLFPSHEAASRQLPLTAQDPSSAPACLPSILCLPTLCMYHTRFSLLVSCLPSLTRLGLVGAWIAIVGFWINTRTHRTFLTHV